MRSLLISFICVITMIGCSNFYPIFLTTPTDEVEIPVDTTMPQDTIDSVGNYLSRDTLLNGTQNIDSSFTLHVSYTMGSDSNLSLFYKLDSTTQLAFTVIQFGDIIPIETKVINGVYHLSSSSLATGLVSIFVEKINKTEKNLNTLLYLQQSDTAKHLNPTYGVFNAAYQYREIINNVNKPIDSVGNWERINYEIGDTLSAYFSCDTALSIIIVDQVNFDRLFDFFNKDSIEYIYEKQQAIERLNIVHDKTELLYYMKLNKADSIVHLTDSLVQIR